MEREIEMTPINLKISENLKELLVRELIEPNYKDEVVRLLNGKTCWRQTGQVFETMSKALVAIGGIISFAAGSYNIHTLSFVAGAISTISLATLQFSAFAFRENKKQGVELNNILKKLKLDEVPLNERSSADDNGPSFRSTSPQKSSSTDSLVSENAALRQEIIALSNILKQKSDKSNQESLDEKSNAV